MTGWFTLLKMGHSFLAYSLILIFWIHWEDNFLKKENFAGGGIRTMDVWCQGRWLYQLSHNITNNLNSKRVFFCLVFRWILGLLCRRWSPTATAWDPFCKKTVFRRRCRCCRRWRRQHRRPRRLRRSTRAASEHRSSIRNESTVCRSASIAFSENHPTTEVRTLPNFLRTFRFFGANTLYDSQQLCLVVYTCS